MLVLPVEFLPVAADKFPRLFVKASAADLGVLGVFFPVPKPWKVSEASEDEATLSLGGISSPVLLLFGEVLARGNVLRKVLEG
jgi:hypothetical protein